MRTLLLSFAIVGVLCGCSSKSDYCEARGIVCDATMNTVTIVTDDNDTLSFSTVDTDKSGVDGLLLGDTAEITYRGKYEKGMGFENGVLSAKSVTRWRPRRTWLHRLCRICVE